MAAVPEISIEAVRSKFGHNGGLASDTVVLADIVNDALEFKNVYVEIDTTGGSSNEAPIYDEHGVYDEPPNCEVALDMSGKVYQRTVMKSLRTYINVTVSRVVNQFDNGSVIDAIHVLT